MRKALIIMLLSSAAGAQIDLSVTVDLGKDLGQNFGTLFEACTEDGRLVFGAGFAGVYNTHHRCDRYRLQFFIRPRESTDAYTMEPLPPVTTDSGAYAYGLGGEVYVRPSGKSHSTLRQWDDEARDWRDAAEDTGHYCATVRGKTLACIDDRILYDGKVILDRPGQGRYVGLYYGNGHLHFYHRIDAEDFNSIVAVPWTPYDEDLTVDMARAVVLRIPFIKEFPYAWGQLNGEVLNCSNWGGLYVFDGKAWRVPVEADEKTSYQIYSMINHHDKLYMAHYPTGRLLIWDGTSVTDSGDWPPVPPGASPSAREAQTTMIYRGELMVGVWPWAELWRRDPDTEAWDFMQRMFTHPELHDVPVHAYEEEATAAGLVLNEFGQRLTSMVPVDDWMLLTTSSKGGATYEPETLSFLTPEQRAEYGAVYRMKMPGNLAATMTWAERPTTFRFVAEAGRMAVFQDGREIAAAEVDPALLTDFPATRIEYGDGVYGPLAGEIIERSTARSSLQLTVRNVSYPETDPGGQDISVHWKRRERTVTIPLARAALILIDVWDVEGERQKNAPVGDRIVNTKIAPLLQAARAADMLVIHAAHRPIGWDGLNTGPKIDARAGDSGAREELPEDLAGRPADPDQWPPREFVYRVGEYGQFSRNDYPLYLPYAHVTGIHPGALPVKRGREYLESSFDRVQTILRENGILHLFYVGQWTNGCVVMRPVGIRNMSALGYNTIILRDATWGSELADTWVTMKVTKGAVLDIEILNGFSALSTDLARELQRAASHRSASGNAPM